jgi:hypothetical protein
LTFCREFSRNIFDAKEFDRLLEMLLKSERGQFWKRSLGEAFFAGVNFKFKISAGMKKVIFFQILIKKNFRGIPATNYNY